mmetsp:Transcript_26265/g.85462  ORF Transcript_26265/g.85462 Transcript_26265/m.85462 type:complete len:249 (+) Transcript_26265:244-990(+)
MLRLQAHQVLEPQRGELERPHAPRRDERRVVKGVGDDLPVGQLQHAVWPATRELPLLEALLDPPALAARASKVADEHGRQRRPRARAADDAHHEQFGERTQGGVVGPKAAAHAKAPARLAGRVCVQLDGVGEVEERRQLLARSGRPVDHHHAPHHALRTQVWEEDAHPLHVLDHVEVSRVRAQHEQRLSGRRSQRLAEVDVPAASGSRQPHTLERVGGPGCRERDHEGRADGQAGGESGGAERHVCDV